MATISDQELENMVRTLQTEFRDQNKTLFNLVSAVDKKSAQKELEGALSRRTRRLGDAMEELGGSFDSASRYLLRSVGEGGLLGAAIAGMVNKGVALTKTYNELVNSGATFKGSLLEMVTATADAGMPLDEFAQATIKSSKAMKQIGEKNWPAFQKSFRDLALTNGQYGLSIDQLNDFQAMHLESMRMANSATKTSAKDLNDLAKQTVAMSAITGVATDQISQLANSVLQGSGALAAIKTLPASMRAMAEKNMQEVLSVLASQAGQAGEFMSRAFANTTAMKGFSEFTAEGQDLINVGMGNVAQMFNDLAKNPSVSKSVQVNNALYDSIEQNMDMLQAQAMGGNQTAKEMMQMFQNMKRLSVEEIERKKKEATEQKGITKMFNTMRVVWDGIVGAFKSGFFKGLKPLMDSFDKLASNGEPHLKTIEEAMGKLGSGLGSLIGTLFAWFTPERIDNIGKFISNFGEGIAQFDWETAFGVIGGAMTTFGAIMGPVNSVLGSFATQFPKFTGAVLGGIGVFLAFKKLKSLFGQNMMVNARNVVVNGGMGGGGDFGGIDLPDGPDKGKGGPARGKDGRFVKASKGGKMSRLAGLGGMGKGLLGKGLLKGAGKSILKKIPGLGLLAGGGFALSRALKGDWGGAGLELLSGIAGSVPGLGTVASLGIDGALMAKDAGTFNKGAGGGISKKGLAIGAGAAGLGIAGGAAALSSMMDSGVESTESENSPVVDGIKTMNDLLKKMVDQITMNNDLTLSSGQSQIMALNKQAALLNKLIERT